MAETEHYAFSEDRKHLVNVKPGETFAADGKVVLAVVLPGGVTHLINDGDQDIRTNYHNGLLIIQGDQATSSVRSYKTWLYHERVPYQAPAPPRVRTLR